MSPGLRISKERVLYVIIIIIFISVVPLWQLCVTEVSWDVSEQLNLACLIDWLPSAN